MKKYTGDEINELAVEVRLGKRPIEELYTALYAEKRRFITSQNSVADTIAKADLEAAWDDAVMQTKDEFKTSFMALLRTSLSGKITNLMRTRIRQKRTEQEYAQKSAPWTQNPQLVQQHDVEFRDFLNRLNPTLRQACQLLDNGLSMKAASEQLGFGDMRTLRNQLQKAFGQYLDTK